MGDQLFLNCQKYSAARGLINRVGIINTNLTLLKPSILIHIKGLQTKASHDSSRFVTIRVTLRVLRENFGPRSLRSPFSTRSNRHGCLDLRGEAGPGRRMLGTGSSCSMFQKKWEIWQLNMMEYVRNSFIHIEKLKDQLYLGDFPRFSSRLRCGGWFKSQSLMPGDPWYACLIHSYTI